MMIQMESSWKANLQRYSDCPADWCKCECHSLRKTSPATRVKAAEEKKRVVVSLEKIQKGFRGIRNSLQKVSGSVSEEVKTAVQGCQQRAEYSYQHVITNPTLVSPPGLVPSVRICMLEIRDSSTSKWLSPSRNMYLMLGSRRRKERFISKHETNRNTSCFRDTHMTLASICSGLFMEPDVSVHRWTGRLTCGCWRGDTSSSQTSLTFPEWRRRFRLGTCNMRSSEKPEKLNSSIIFQTDYGMLPSLNHISVTITTQCVTPHIKLNRTETASSFQMSEELLTCQQHFELLVVKLRLPLWHQAALGALSHRINKTHAGQRRLLTAALVAETAAAPPTVVLQKQRHHRHEDGGSERSYLRQFFILLHNRPVVVKWG